MYLKKIILILFILSASITMAVAEENAILYTNEVQQQKKKISGLITDTSNMPIIGANVVEKGTSNGAITDVDGKFSLDVESGTTLVISYIGYLEQEIIVGSSTKLNIILHEDEQTLDEVVVVGYGTQKKVSVVGAVTTISPSELQFGTTRSLSNNIGGQLAGIIAVQRSGEPGYDNSGFEVSLLSREVLILLS